MPHSINVKFSLMTSITVIILLMGFGAYNYFETSRSLNASLEKQVNSVLGRLKISLPTTIWNYEAEQMASIVASEVSNDVVHAIYVFDTKGMVSGQVKSSSGVDTVTKLPDDLGRMKEASLQYDKDGAPTTVGRVVLSVDSSSIDELLMRSLTRLVVQTVIMVVILVALISVLMKGIVIRPIEMINEALKDIAAGEGDLTQRLSARRKDELGRLALQFNLFVEKIQDLVQKVQDSVQELNSANQETNAIASETSAAVDQQRHETDQVAAAMHEFDATAHDVAKNAVEGATAAERAKTTGSQAQKVVQEAIRSINKLAQDIDSSSAVISDLEKEVANITSVLDVIRGIAEQTNLLALNAAIEAARAGEQGRGFAVVADEVRTLASKTQASTEEIQEMISRLQNGTSKAVSVMHNSKTSGDATVELARDANDALNGIANAIDVINDMNTQIASAAEEQTAVTEEINRSLTRISELADKTSSQSSASKAASDRLTLLGQTLQALVGKFKVR